MKGNFRPDLILELALLRIAGAVSPADCQEKGNPEQERERDETEPAVREQTTNIQAANVVQQGGQLNKPTVSADKLRPDNSVSKIIKSDQESELDLQSLRTF